MLQKHLPKKQLKRKLSKRFLTRMNDRPCSTVYVLQGFSFSGRRFAYLVMTGINMVKKMSSEHANLIVVGAVKGAHGVRGDVRVKSFTSDPEAVFEYGPLLDKSGAAVVTVQSSRTAKDHFIVRAKETRTKEEWDALKGTLLHVPRSALPTAEEDEFYISDMVGLDVYAGGDTAVGKVESIQNFGAGDLVEIKPLRGGKSILVPFTLADIPAVDITARRLIVPAFDEWLAAEDEVKDEK